MKLCFRQSVNPFIGFGDCWIGVNFIQAEAKAKQTVPVWPEGNSDVFAFALPKKERLVLLAYYLQLFQLGNDSGNIHVNNINNNLINNHC